MNKVSIYLIDARELSFDELLTFTNLEKNEISFLDKYHSVSTKKEKLISYYFKKKYVGEWYLGKDGKPLSNNVYFNISGSKGVVVLAISKDTDVGIDIEVLRPINKELIDYVCNDEELPFIKSEVDFISIWTNKESVVKCLGTGIKNNLKNIPGLPLNGKKCFEGQTFYSKTIKYKDAVISLTINSDKEFDYELILEK